MSRLGPWPPSDAAEYIGSAEFCALLQREASRLEDPFAADAAALVFDWLSLQVTRDSAWFMMEGVDGDRQPRFVSRAKWRAYLARALRRAAAEAARQRTRRRDLARNSALSRKLERECDHPWVAAARAEQVENLNAAITRLGKPDRLIVALLLEGLSQSDLARRLGISRQAAHTRVMRVLQRLREHLVQTPPEHDAAS